MKLYTGNPDTTPVEGEAVKDPKALLETKLIELEAKCQELDSENPAWSSVNLDIAHTLLDLERNDEAWEKAREVFDFSCAMRDWEIAIEACEIMYKTDLPLALAALGNGVWLAVTFPVSPEITIEMLRMIVDDTPADSDGAAVAAATACYIADIRANRDEKQHENLVFYTGQILSNVAFRHSEVKEQGEFNAWVKRLELDEPEKFLIRLRNVIDVMVQDDWWIDRDTLREELPEH